MRISDWSSDVCSSDLESEKTIASIFSKAKLYHPTILFIDEIQAIFGSRSAGSFSSKVISQLLLEFDGIEEYDVIIIAATNCPEMIDESFRSEERRVGKECVSTCRSSWSLYHKK